MSAIAACCSRDSPSSLPRAEAGERSDRLVTGAERRLVFAGLWSLTEPALRFFAAFVFPAPFADRAISAPEGEQGHLIGLNRHSGRGEPDRIGLADCAG